MRFLDLKIRGIRLVLHDNVIARRDLREAIAFAVSCAERGPAEESSAPLRGWLRASCYPWASQSEQDARLPPGTAKRDETEMSEARSTIHHLAATPRTIQFGIFDALIPPVLTIDSGDTVTMECLSGGLEVMPQDQELFPIPSALRAIHDAGLARIGTHMMTGPVAVRGAVPGDMLEVRIEAVEPGSDWGYCGFRPLAGTIPEDFPVRFMSHIPVDRAAGTCRLPWGPQLDLAPFFGIMGTAPPASWGRLSSREPRAFGGNLDNKELVAGSTLYLPVMVEGGNFSAGDGHGLQGDGEVCVNALEMCLNGRFTLVLHKGSPNAPLLHMPRAETATHWITMGTNEDLDQAMKQALREMIALICARTDLSREQAYQTCSLAVDFRVTQTVNGEKGVHGMLRKGLLF
jgi:acetamidase/formamidase